ncbi:MAG: hypothetical protein KDA41_14535, partial [Planctomycetales bacterium]|nr:hypothetical protein [Planctomycetales bacterium]
MGLLNRCEFALLAAMILPLGVVGCAAPAAFSHADVAMELECRSACAAAGPLAPNDCCVPDRATLENGLTETTAVAVGLWNNPGYQELLTDLEIARADVITAHQLTNPDVQSMFPLSVKQ